MSKAEALHTVAIYLKGDDLMPEELSARLGVVATKSHRRGQKSIAKSGKEIVARTGLWKSSRTAKSAIDLPLLLQQVASELLASGNDLSSLPGVEDAFVDIFIAQTAEHDGGGTSEFFMDAAAVATLNQLALPVRFTVAIIRD